MSVQSQTFSGLKGKRFESSQSLEKTREVHSHMNDSLSLEGAL